MSENVSTIVREKLEKDNFQAWRFRMTNFLMGKGVWPFINGDEQEPILGAAPIVADLKTFKEWHEKARKVMYWLSVSVSNSMIVHTCHKSHGGGTCASCCVKHAQYAQGEAHSRTHKERWRPKRFLADFFFFLLTLYNVHKV